MIYNLKLLNFNSTPLLIALIVPFLITGPFFPDLIVSVSSIFFLYYIFKKKDFYYFLNKPIIIFFIFCVYCILISIFKAQDMMLSFESSLFYFRVGVFSCFIWYLIDKNKNILTYFYYALILSFSVLVIDGFLQYFTGQNILGFPAGHHYRISSFFGDELVMGSYLSRLLPLLYALYFLKPKQKLEMYLMGLLFVLVHILIFISGERTGFLFLLISSFFIIILVKGHKYLRLTTLVTSIILIFFIAQNSPKLSYRMFVGPGIEIGILDVKMFSNKYLKSSGHYGSIPTLQKDQISKQQDLTDSKKLVIFSPAHDSLIRTAYNMFEDQPLFGHGPKMFRLMCKDKKYAEGMSPCMTHPHNFYVQLLAETGIIGFLFLSSSLGYVLFTALRQLKTMIFCQKRFLTDYQVCLLAGIFISVWPISPNGNFFNNWLMIIYCLPVGFYLQSIYSKNKLIEETKI